MLLLIDENVPVSVGEFFSRRGHEVKYVVDLFARGTPDPVIATIGDRLDAVLVSWDRDFRKIAPRIPQGTRTRFKNLGRISFSCDYADGRRLLEKWIDAIELHYEIARRNSDVRMIIEIQGTAYKAW